MASGRAASPHGALGSNPTLVSRLLGFLGGLVSVITGQRVRSGAFFIRILNYKGKRRRLLGRLRGRGSAPIGKQ